MKQDPVKRAEAILRVSAEALQPISTFTRLVGVSKEAITRYATQGKKGIHLDAIRDPVQGWMTSTQAIARFQLAVAKREAEEALNGKTLTTNPTQTRRKENAS